MASQTTVKVANQTGAAKDDLLTASATGLTEDNTYAKLDVLANDPGAAKLYSLVQDTSNYASTSQFPVATSATLASGAKITINADGTIGYDASSLQASLQSYAAGELFTDTFFYTVRMGNGALSTAKVAVTIAGVNDAPTLASVAPVSIFDTAADDTPDAVVGTLHGADVDHGAILTYSFLDGSQVSVNEYGTLTLNAKTGAYSFLADPDKIDALAEGMNATASFTVKVADEHGASSAPVTLKFNLIGANDTASITGVNTGSVTEDGVQIAAGLLKVSDRDIGQSVFQSPASLSGAYGDFAFNAANGEWTYSLRNGDANVQALNAGKIVSDEIVVTSLDGTASTTLHVDVVGTNDAARIDGVAAGTVTEDGGITAGGIVTVHDVDTGEAVFRTLDSLAGQYGTFSFDAGTGNWAYTLNNDSAAVQSLNGGKVVFDEIVVTSLDGTASAMLHVDVLGTNDVARIDGVATGTVTEDSVTAASGTLTVHDVDAGEAGFRAPDSLAGQYGTFSFDVATGNWAYALNNDNTAVQALNGGQTVFDELVVTSLDGSASQTILVSVNGADEAPAVSPANPVTVYKVNYGQSDINNRVYFDHFDSNDLLSYSNNYSFKGISLIDTDGNGTLDSSTAKFEFTNNGGKHSVVEVILIGYTGLTESQIVH